MTATNWQGRQRELPRIDASYISAEERHYAQTHPRGRKLLAILLLRESQKWTFAEIGGAFGHNPGSVCRMFHRARGDLRKIFSRRCADAR
jgi:DNA-directed RNA polymerase specialized sigma24 family protein